MATIPIYSRLFDKLDVITQSFFDETLSNVINAFKPTMTILLLIYIGIMGYRAFFGLSQEPIKEVFVRLIRICIIYAIATNQALYSQFVSSWLWQLPDALASVIVGGQNADNGNFLDEFLSQFYETYQLFVDASDKDSNAIGIPNLEFLLGGWLVLGAGIVLTLYAAVFVVTAKIALAILLPVGSIFIFSISFDSTRKFFDAWIGQILSFAFKIMLLAAILKLSLSTLQDYITDALQLMAQDQQNVQILQIVPVLIFSGVSLVVMRQISAMGSALGGGIAISTLGSFGGSFKQLSKTSERLKLDKPKPTTNNQTNSISNKSKPPVGHNLNKKHRNKD